MDSIFKKVNPLGIDLRNLSIFKCNKCEGDLILMDGAINNNQVIDGKLKCSCGEEYYIEAGILKVGEVCTKLKVNFNHDFVMEYVNVTDISYLDNLHKGFEWMFRKISDCNLNNKVLLELGTGVGFFLRNIYNEIPDNCLYIAVDHDFERQKFLKSLFERIDCKKNIIFICSDFLEVPIKEKSVDIVLDISGTSNYSFEHEDFLLNLVDSYVKETIGKEMDSIQEDRQQEKKVEGSVFSVLLSRPILLFFSLILFCYSFEYSQWGFTLPLHLGEIYKNSGASYYGIVVAVNGASVILITPLISKITSSVKSIGGLFYAIAFGMFSVTNRFPLFLFLTIIMTIGEIMININASTFIANHTPSSHRGRVSAILPLISGAGYAFGPITMGKIITKYSISSGWIIIGSLGLISTFMMFLLQRIDKDIIKD